MATAPQTRSRSSLDLFLSRHQSTTTSAIRSVSRTPLPMDSWYHERCLQAACFARSGLDLMRHGSPFVAQLLIQVNESSH